MKEVRIIIAGSRGFNNYELLVRSVNDLIFSLEQRNTETGIGEIDRVHERDHIKIISGTARGADQLGEKFAQEYGYEVVRFPADWNNLGKRAGYVRNASMAEYASADNNVGVLLAFWDGVSKGTKHMIDLAQRYGLEVHIVQF